MASILILIGGHLCNAPRPQKEAAALAAAGHDVVIGGIWFDPLFVDRDRQLCHAQPWKFHPLVDFQATTLKHRLSRLGVRGQSRLARALFSRWQIVLPALLGYGARAMLRFALKHQADLTIVHSEAGLWVGQQLQQRGYTVGVDFEDWFSEDLLPATQAQRPLTTLKQLETQLLRSCDYCLTTSNAMAQAMAQASDSTLPTVIYNAFPRLQTQDIDGQYHDRKNLSIPSLHWFSQTIGPGRGLESLLAALPYLSQPVEIHLRGSCPTPYRQWLETQVPEGWHDRLFIHPTVPNGELLSRIAEHDIGLALENPAIPSRNLTVTNKLFQYWQAGLAVIASDTAGQREMLHQYPTTGQCIPPQSPIALAQAIQTWLDHPEQLQQAKAAAQQAAIDLCWETQATKLVQTATTAIARSRPATAHLAPLILHP